MTGVHPTGTRVRKINSEDNDYHGDGDLGSLALPPAELYALFGGHCLQMPMDSEVAPGEWFYFVDWDATCEDLRGQPVGTMGRKLELL